MDRRIRQLGAWLALIALVANIGGHWLILQSVAWAGMLADFSRDTSLTDAIGKTFDGEHPCNLCVKVQDGRAQEERDKEQSPSLTVESGHDVFCAAAGEKLLAIPPSNELPMPIASLSYSGLAHAPPTPPPRGFARETAGWIQTAAAPSTKAVRPRSNSRAVFHWGMNTIMRSKSESPGCGTSRVVRAFHAPTRSPVHQPAHESRSLA